MQIPMQDIC